MPRTGLGVVHRIALTGRMMVQHVLARKLEYEPRSRHKHVLSLGPHVGFLLLNPPQLRSDRLRRQHRARAVEDLGPTEFGVQFANLLSAAGINTVQNRRTQGHSRSISEQYARPHPTHAHRAENTASLQGFLGCLALEQLFSDLDEFAPPDVAVHLDVPRHRAVGGVLPRRRTQNVPTLVREYALGTRCTNVHPEKDLRRHGSSVSEIDYSRNFF